MWPFPRDVYFEPVATMSKRESDGASSMAKKLKDDSETNAFSHQQQQQRQQAQGERAHHSDIKEEFGKPDNEGSSNAGSHAVAAAAAAAAVEHRPTISIQPTTLPETIKPAHGSDEWHKQRRENHKEVEKRRRESINAGIKELASLIPTSDTNKSQILQRAIEYIKRLKENETNNIEKWTLEKLLTEQAVSELDASNTKLKQELERAYREIEHYKRAIEKKE